MSPEKIARAVSDKHRLRWSDESIMAVMSSFIAQLDVGEEAFRKFAESWAKEEIEQSEESE